MLHLQLMNGRLLDLYDCLMPEIIDLLYSFLDHSSLLSDHDPTATPGRLASLLKLATKLIHRLDDLVLRNMEQGDDVSVLVG